MPIAYVVVVTGRPGTITASLERALVEAAGVRRGSLRVLAAGEAVEVAVEARSVEEARVVASELAARLDAPVDVNAIGTADRRKRLLLSDMDSTIIEQECIDEMADVFGLKPRIAAITERAMRGELDFETALRERLGLLAGLDEAALQRVYDERVTLMPGARTLVATMKGHGAYTALVSGGFTFFTSRVARAAGFDINRANQLAFADGRMTGDVVGAVLGKAAKRATLQELAGARGLPMSATMAAGDGANDLDMIRAAGLGVAYRAKPVVAAEASAAITHGDLSALLYLQGYRRDEFVDG